MRALSTLASQGLRRIATAQAPISGELAFAKRSPALSDYR